MIETLVPEDFRNLTGNVSRVEYQATLQKLGRFDLWSAYSHEINAYPCPLDKSWRDFVARQPTPEFKSAAGQCAATTVIRALAWEPDLIAQCEALHLANQVRQDAGA